MSKVSNLLLMREMNSVQLCAVQPSLDNSLPDKIQILPAGLVIVGNDGRVFVNQNANEVVNSFLKSGRDIVVDWEHETVMSYDRAPAAGWVHAVELDQDGSMWAHVNWTPDGAKSITNKEFRYVSPAFYIDEALNITELQSIGLTNRPNLRMNALNKQEFKTGADKMEKILQTLELSETATQEEAVLAINSLKEKTVDVSKFVPLADFELAVNRAKAAEAKLVEQEAEQKREQIKIAINAAVTSGKIAPSSIGFFTDVCNSENGIEKFNSYLENINPVLKPGVDSHFEKNTPTQRNVDGLSDVEKLVCEKMGINNESFKVARG